MIDTIPTENIFWRDIPSNAKVQLIRNIYVVTLPDNSRKVAYWTGSDAIVAQVFLDKMTHKGV